MIAPLVLAMLASPSPQWQVNPPTAEVKGFATLLVTPTWGSQSVYNFGVLGSDAKARKVVHWAKRRVTSQRDGSYYTQWADGRTCPGVERAVAALAALPPVSVRVRGYQDSIFSVLDGTQYTLEAESSYGDSVGSALNITTNEGTPLSAWAGIVDRELDGCWGPHAPA